MKLWLALLLLLLPSTALSATVILDYTLPTHNIGKTFDSEAVDSVPDCGVIGDSLRDLKYSYLIGVPASGGSPLGVVLRTHIVTGMEGQPDTFQVDDSQGWHYTVQTADSLFNKSCVSNMIYVGPITGIPVQPDGVIVDRKVFDIHGRLVKPLAVGVYFERVKYSNGKVLVRKIGAPK